MKIKTSKKNKLVKTTTVEKKKIEKMIHDLFRVCDCWVDIDCFVRFENDFCKAVKKHGFDLHQIYYGKSFAEMKRTYKRYDELKKKIKFPYSDIIAPQKSKSGTKYVVFSMLPKDQQKAWLEGEQSFFTSPICKEEPENAVCIYYHDYEKFYDNRVTGIMVAHINKKNS
ncbi:MAG: hypothetical protein A3F72_02740 [Bacteroidetes bacterium RIFCSPLOWO2_12_FULL_35_15]|nr:MAG: hypothetical protein A3F72_02740 [Bacteroidetes bacterium RIFCSPLOWO2_12_FULL_35_15]